MDHSVAKFCPRCEKTKTDFRTWRGKENNLCNACLDPHIVWHKKRDRKGLSEYRRKWNQSAKGKASMREHCQRRKYLSYGLTKQDYEDLIKLQNCSCAICGQKVPKDKFHTDHNHKTGQVRSLLCGLCNRGLGQFKDNTESLQKAISYLNYWNNKTYKTCGE